MIHAFWHECTDTYSLRCAYVHKVGGNPAILFRVAQQCNLAWQGL